MYRKLKINKLTQMYKSKRKIKKYKRKIKGGSFLPFKYQIKLKKYKNKNKKQKGGFFGWKEIWS